MSSGTLREAVMSSNESKNEMLVMVVTDLAAICKKLGENSAVPEELRTKARHFVDEFNLLEPYRGRGSAYQHFAGEKLLEKMALLLPRLLEVQAQPAIASGE